MRCHAPPGRPPACDLKRQTHSVRKNALFETGMNRKMDMPAPPPSNWCVLAPLRPALFWSGFHYLCGACRVLRVYAMIAFFGERRKQGCTNKQKWKNVALFVAFHVHAASGKRRALIGNTGGKTGGNTGNKTASQTMVNTHRYPATETPAP